MTHPTGDALRAREEAGPHVRFPATILVTWETPVYGTWEIAEEGETPGEGQALYLRDGPHLLDLRSEAGRGILALARMALAMRDHPEIRENVAQEAMQAAGVVGRAGLTKPHVTAALALLDAKKEEPHG